MFDTQFERTSPEAAIERRRELTEESPLNGTVLLDDDLDGAAGGAMHIGEEIPQ